MASRLRAWSLLAPCVLSCLACSGNPSNEHGGVEARAELCRDPHTLSFAADPGAADEAYVCFGFDAAAAHAGLGGIVWSPPDPSGATALHHATLYAVPSSFPDGPLPCDGMPSGAVGLHVWSLGGDNLELPPDTALDIPAGTKRLVIEAHVRRAQPGHAGDASATLCAPPDTVARHAAFLGYSAPVPALRPMHEDEADGSCQLGQDAHLWSIWPHMHLAGREIAVQLQSATGQAQSLVDVNPWNFHQQRTYVVGLDARAGDTLHTHCRWQNNTDSYIFAGPRSENEMCNTGLVVWPAEAAICE